MTVWFPMHSSVYKSTSALPQQNEAQKNAMFFAGGDGYKRQKRDSAAAASDTFVSSSRHSQESQLPEDILSQEALLALKLLPDKDEGLSLETTSLPPAVNIQDFDDEFQDFDDTWIFQDHPTTTTTPFESSPPFATSHAHSSSSAFQPPAGEVELNRTPAERQRLMVTKRAQALFGPYATANDYYHRSATKRAQALLGSDAKPADYERLMATKRAQAVLGPNATANDYYHRSATKRAQALLGPNATRADYHRHNATKLAQAVLGPNATANDYYAYRKAIREKKLPKNATAEQYWEYKSKKPTRRKKAELHIPNPSPKPGS